MVLKPKVDTPQTLRDFRPISLCNVVYKIVSKVLSNRLKEVLPGLIDKVQSPFVAGRVIQDNMLIIFEIIHAMKNRRSGRRGDMAMKINISKAMTELIGPIWRVFLLNWGFLKNGWDG